MNRKLKNSELERKTLYDFKTAPKNKVVIILDNIRSMHNIGSVFRSADAFLMEKIYLCGITATPPQKEIHKTALGATESVSWSYHKETLEAIAEVRAQGYTILAIEQTEKAETLGSYSIDTQKKYALIFGHEVKGVDQNVVDACDEVIEIPQEGTKHSLNISVSAGVVLWEFYKQFAAKKGH